MTLPLFWQVICFGYIRLLCQFICRIRKFDSWWVAIMHVQKKTYVKCIFHLWDSASIKAGHLPKNIFNKNVVFKQKFCLPLHLNIDLKLWDKVFIVLPKAVLRIRIWIRSDPVFFGHPDPDPDPGKYRIRIRILYPQKDPMLFKFSCYKIV